MKNEIFKILQVNTNFLTTEIEQMEKYDFSKVRNLFDAVHNALLVMAITHCMTPDEADFALEQSANCLSYLVKEKFGIDLQIVKM